MVTLEVRKDSVILRVVLCQRIITIWRDNRPGRHCDSQNKNNTKNNFFQQPEKTENGFHSLFIHRNDHDRHHHHHHHCHRMLAQKQRNVPRH